MQNYKNAKKTLTRYIAVARHSKQVFLVMPTSSKAHNVKKQFWDIRKILSTGEVLLTGKKNHLFSRVDKVDLQPMGLVLHSK